MFKRLKRIEALLERIVDDEDECLRIVQRREIEYKLEKSLAQAEVGKPYKCLHPGCTIELPHAHVVAMEG